MDTHSEAGSSDGSQSEVCLQRLREQIQGRAARLHLKRSLSEAVADVEMLLGDVLDYCEDFPDMPLGDSHALACLVDEAERVLEATEIARLELSACVAKVRSAQVEFRSRTRD